MIDWYQMVCLDMPYPLRALTLGHYGKKLVVLDPYTGPICQQLAKRLAKRKLGPMAGQTQAWTLTCQT